MKTRKNSIILFSVMTALFLQLTAAEIGFAAEAVKPADTNPAQAVPAASSDVKTSAESAVQAPVSPAPDAAVKTESTPEVNQDVKSDIKPETAAAPQTEASAKAGASKSDAKQAMPEKKAKNTNVNAGVIALVESVSGPVNPSETDICIKLEDGNFIDAILSPNTRYYPDDYMPCDGDSVRVSYAELGSVRKRIYVYSIEFIKESKKQDEQEKAEKSK